MRRRRRRISRSNPLPPLSLVLQSRIAIPHDVHCASLWPTCSTATACKGGSIVVGQRHQRRAVCSLPRRRNGVQRARARRGGRGRAVVACDVEAVTHFPHHIATHLHLLTQLTCISALAPSRAMLRPARQSRIHRAAHTPQHVPRSRHSCIHRATRTHQDLRFFASILTFLLPSYHATLWLPSSVQP